MSTTYEACLAIGLDESSIKYGLLKKQFIAELGAGNKKPEEDLTYDHRDELFYRCTGDWAYSFGELGYECFYGIKFKCEEELSELDLDELLIVKSNFQEKLNELTKGENLINFEIRVIKHVY